MILVIDNYDSFTYNLVQYLGELGKECRVFRNDKITFDELKTFDFSSVIISPGPGTPDTAGISKALIAKYAGKIPILGVCLGHQAIGEVFGGKVVKAPYLMHGKISLIHFNPEEKLFKDLKNPFSATRYHSLVVQPESLVETELEVIARTQDNIIMALKHKKLENLYGIQFHPESILTESGHQLLSNFLGIKS